MRCHCIAFASALVNIPSVLPHLTIHFGKLRPQTLHVHPQPRVALLLDAEEQLELKETEDGSILNWDSVLC